MFHSLFDAMLLASFKDKAMMISSYDTCKDLNKF